MPVYKSGIYTISQISKLFEEVETSYPELIEYSGSLGTTFERNSIPVIGLHLNPARKIANTRLENVNPNTEPLVFVSYIIASDYVTIDSAVGLLATILHRYAAKDRAIIEILSYKTIWIIPVLNVDSAVFLYKYYAEKHFKTVIYKNRRADNYTNENKCGAHGTGVNLNKNFAIGFYYSADLTENFPCSSFYGGVKPLSEPETKGLDEFLDKVNPQLVVGLFGDGHMIATPDLSVAPKSDDFAAQYKAWVQRFQVLNQLSGGLEMYDPIKHEKPSLQSKGGNLDEYLLYQKRFVPLSYYVGLEGSKGKFFPRKDEIVQILESDIPNLVYLSCLTGKYFDLRTLEETYCKSDQTCLPIPSDVPKHYYGVKLRVTELGTISSQSDSSGVTLCIRIPDLKHFYLDLAFDKNKKKLSITPLNNEADKEPGFSVSCLDLGKFASYSDKSVYLVLRQTITQSSEQTNTEGSMIDWDMEMFIRGRPKCGAQSVQMSFELQFYMLQNASGLARGLVLGITAFALIVVCLKLFCCRKVQGEIVSSSDPSDGSDIIENPKGASTSIEMTSMDDEDPDRRVKARTSTEAQTIIED